MREKNSTHLGGKVMKSVKNIKNTVAAIGIVILLFGCSFNKLQGETLYSWDEGVVSTYVTTTPDSAKLSLVNVDRGIGATISSAKAPNVVQYIQLYNYGAYLMVSHPGYKTKRVRLDSQKELHVNLEPITEEKVPCKALVTFSRAFAYSSNLPDLSHVVTDEASIPEMINEALNSDALNNEENECADGMEPNLPAAVVSIEDGDYSPEGPYTGKISITSTPENAELLLDGYLMGTTPMEIPVQSGHHRVVLRDSRHEDWSTQITINGNIEKRINVDMVPTSRAMARSKADADGNI